MDKEIKRNTWSRFCKKFTSDNRYRPTKMSVKKGGNGETAMEMHPFMGIALSKKGRLIDGIQLYTGRWNPENVAGPVMTVKEPTAMHLEKDKNGCDTRLHIMSKDGTEVVLNIDGEQDPQQARQLIEKVAYAMAERRGHTPGQDMKDWLEAEHKVREAETQLTE
jgi:hypothetical protein